jgi:pilus assembly protein CpaB
LEQTFFLVPSEEQRPRLVSQTILQDIRVLQVGDFESAKTVPVTATTEAPAVPGQEQPVVVESPPDIITLIVTPQEAVTINYLLYSGAELTLVLRAANDDTRNQTESVTLQFLLDEYKIEVPAKGTIGQANRIDELIAPSLANDVQPTPAP